MLERTLTGLTRSLWLAVGLLIAAVWLIPTARAVETCSGGTCTQPADVTGGSVTPTRWVAMSYTGCNAPATYTTAAACANALGGASRTLKPGYPKATSDGHYVDFWYTDLIEYLVYPICAAGSTLTYVANTLPTCQAPTSYSCPANAGWTLSGTNCTRPQCGANQGRDSTNGQCKEACDNASTIDQYEGMEIAGGFDYQQGMKLCMHGCQYTPAAMGIKAGKVSGAVLGPGTGVSCSTTTVGTGGISSATDQPSVSQAETGAGACIKSGQSYGTVNGAVVCTGKNDTQESTKTVKKEVTKPDGSKGTTEKEEVTTCKGEQCTTKSTEKNSGGGASGTATNGTTTGSTKEEKGSFCENNPESPQCKDAESGEAAEVSGLYEKEDKTVDDVIGTFKSTVQGAGFYNAASSYFSASMPSGSCTGMAVDVSPPLGAAWHIDLGNYLCGSTAASLYSLLGIGVMLAAGWVAFRIAIL